MACSRICIALSLGLLARCIAAEDPCGLANGDPCCSCDANPNANPNASANASAKPNSRCKKDQSGYCLNYRVCGSVRLETSLVSPQWPCGCDVVQF